MASENLEIVRGGISAVNSRDLDAIVGYWTEDVVFDWSRSISPYSGVYSGRPQVRRFLDSFFEAWEEVWWDPQELIEVAPDKVVIDNVVRGRGRGSGVEIQGRGGHVWTLREGKVSSVCLFQSRDEALEWARREEGASTRASNREARLERLAHARLYFVCEARPNGSDPAMLLGDAVANGADMIQLRDKDLDDGALVEAARGFRAAADEHGALFLLNDRPDLVAACEADGVHIGQEDMDLGDARAVLPPDSLLGLSTHSQEQIEAAQERGDEAPDYISVGPIWETPTKQGRPAVGLTLIDTAARIARLPWFAIGGIDVDNVGEVVAAGARRIVAVRAIRDADDPAGVARTLRDAVEAAVEVG